MESSPEHLATICVGYRETFRMRRNAPENNFALYCLAIFLLDFANLNLFHVYSIIVVLANTINKQTLIAVNRIL